MRWFQLDADMPNDLRIRSIVETCGLEGLGMLVKLWCFVAKHGSKPGVAVDSNGKPIAKALLVSAAGGSRQKFDRLIAICRRVKHVEPTAYRKRGLLIFPAMSRRADTYTRRAERLFEPRSNKVRTQAAHTSTSTSTSNKTPLTPLQGGRRLTRAELKFAAERRSRVHGGCPHSPRCATVASCVHELALEARAK